LTRGEVPELVGGWSSAEARRRLAEPMQLDTGHSPTNVEGQVIGTMWLNVSLPPPKCRELGSVVVTSIAMAMLQRHPKS
jgi:hypothetical protein